MQKNYFHRVSHQTPTRFWINNVTREEADIALREGAVGCTQNPSYVHKMLVHNEESTHAESLLKPILMAVKDDDLAQELLQRELVKEIALKFHSLWERTNGRWGYVSIQGNPFKEDVDNIIRSARLNSEVAPNIMAKIPVTSDGLKAMEVLMAEGIPINATEVMSVRQAMDVCDVYDKVSSGMSNPPVVYYSHITGIYDEYLSKYAKDKKIDISDDFLWQSGMIIAKKIHRLTCERQSNVGFIGGGARNLHHFTEMVGANACITINWKGTAENLIQESPPVIDRFHSNTSDNVLDALLEKVDDFSKAWFINGISQEEYESFGPVVLFRESFESSWKKAREIISTYR